MVGVFLVGNSGSVASVQGRRGRRGRLQPTLLVKNSLAGPRSIIEAIPRLRTGIEEEALRIALPLVKVTKNEQVGGTLLKTGPRY
jgi:hypothetical protein